MTSKKWIIPVVVGSALVAFALISLLYIKKRSSSSTKNNDDDEVFVKASKTADSDDSQGIEVDLEGNVGGGGGGGGKKPDAVWSKNAYDAITSPTSSSLLRSKSFKEREAPSSAAANAAVAGTAAVVAAAASAAAKSSSKSRTQETKATKGGSSMNTPSPNNNNNKTKNIDSILNDFSDGDSSFISDSSSAATSTRGDDSINDTSVLSGMSGLSGILADAPPLLDDVTRNVSGFSADGSSTNNNDNDTATRGGGSYLPQSLSPTNKDATTKKDNSSPSSNLRKQESFEGTYRTRSAMAKLNLKKDILHVACDTHDAPIESEETDAAAAATNESKGGDKTPLLISASANAAGVASSSYGMSRRTISAKKHTSMIEKQRLAEKLSMKSYGTSKSKKKRQGLSKEEEEKRNANDEKDLILPVNFQRSDSIAVDDQGSSNDGSED